MKALTASNIYQSNRLICYGVDTNTADMFWQVPVTVSQKRQGEHILLIRHGEYELYPGDIPAWSLSALLTSVLPARVEIGSLKAELRLSTRLTDNGNCIWGISYQFGETPMCYHESADPIQACIEMIEWLAKHRRADKIYFL
ncbi:hypothetical protein ED352_04500 [Muribaculaceae bacterium Isolate-002 (NCI)]|nr:hypothetical protein ED352_04500 [Muribaculaceae bacterium Isolate-002 (NCI)]